jgi:hypothetical protein
VEKVVFVYKVEEEAAVVEGREGFTRSLYIAALP